MLHPSRVLVPSETTPPKSVNKAENTILRPPRLNKLSDKPWAVWLAGPIPVDVNELYDEPTIKLVACVVRVMSVNDVVLSS